MSEAESEWTPGWRLWPRGGAGSGPRCGGATRSSAVSGVRPPWGERLGRPVQCDRSEHRGLRGAGPAAGTLARPAPQSDACSPWRVCGCARASVGLRVCVPLGPGVFTPQSCVHVSCPPCARARRVDCVCLHLMCNSVCVCVCVCVQFTCTHVNRCVPSRGGEETLGGLAWRLACVAHSPWWSGGQRRPQRSWERVWAGPPTPGRPGPPSPSSMQPRS